MKKYCIFAIILLIPLFAFAAKPSAGLTPASRFYFLDTLFEKIDLSLTFNSEKKAQKALKYADERLAEVEVVAEEKNTNAVKVAITGYESSIALASEESKQIKNKEKTESLLTSISDSTSKHQVILANVLNMVPNEAKEAITKSIEVNRKGQEEATKQTIEPKSEVEQFKKEVIELKERQDMVQPVLKQPTFTTQNSQKQKKSESTTIDNKPQTQKTEEKTEIENLKRELQDIKIAQEALKPPPSIRRINISRANYTNDNVIRTNVPHRVLSANVVSEGNSPVSFSDLRVCMEGTAPYNVIDYIFLEKNPGKHYFLDVNGCSIINDESFSLQPKGIGGSGTGIVVYISLVKEIPISNSGKTVIFVLKSIETDGEILGNLPINGYEYKMPPPLPQLPKVTVSHGMVDNRTNQPYKKPGTKDYIFAGIKITTDKEVFLNSIKWDMSGSGNGFENLRTYINDVPYNIIQSSDGKKFTSNFNRVIVNVGETKEIYLTGDILEKNHHTLDFNIYKDSDINITDENGNVIIPKAEQLWNYENSGGFRSGNPWYDGYKIEMEPEPPRP